MNFWPPFLSSPSYEWRRPCTAPAVCIETFEVLVKRRVRPSKLGRARCFVVDVITLHSCLQSPQCNMLVTEAWPVEERIPQQNPAVSWKVMFLLCDVVPENKVYPELRKELGNRSADSPCPVPVSMVMLEPLSQELRVFHGFYIYSSLLFQSSTAET